MTSPQLPFAQVDTEFVKKSRQTYANMKARFTEKRNKKGRITRIGREVPFTLEEFRDWLLLKLGTEGGVVKCPYCAAFLSINEAVVDHRIPASQGGSLDLGNLDLICKQDNDQKGGMCGECYQELLEWSAVGASYGDHSPGVHPACRQNMLHRLAIAVQLAARQRAEMAKKFKAASRTTPELVEEEPF